MLSYRKVAFEYYSLLNVLCGDHCGALAGFGSDVVGHVLTSIQEGIRSTDGKIVVEACTALDNLCSFYVSETGKTSPVSAQLAQHFAAHPAALPSLLATLISVVVYEESPSYTLSRPMFALILMNPQWLDEARAQVGIRLGADRLETFNGACERLLQNVEMNLDARNRDQFSQNVTEFRQTMRKVL
jgi:exportin-7